MSVLVRADAVTKTFREGTLETPVLHGITLTIPDARFCLLMGPSGSGKTTLISILAGLMRPTSGTVTLCDSIVSHTTPAGAARVRREHLGFVFQSYNLFPALTALDNVAEVLALRGASRRVARERAREVLVEVGLGDRLDHRPSQLSGGQKQRVAIARALAGRPSLLVGDEPTAALDSVTGMGVIGLLREHVGAGRSVLLVTHDARLERFADTVFEIEDGRIVCERAGGWKAQVA